MVPSPLMPRLPGDARGRPVGLERSRRRRGGRRQREQDGSERPSPAPSRWRRRRRSADSSGSSAARRGSLSARESAEAWGRRANEPAAGRQSDCRRARRPTPCLGRRTRRRNEPAPAGIHAVRGRVDRTASASAGRPQRPPTGARPDPPRRVVGGRRFASGLARTRSPTSPSPTRRRTCAAGGRDPAVA